MKNRKCKFCNNKFEVKNIKKKFCSRNCRFNFWKSNNENKIKEYKKDYNSKYFLKNKEKELKRTKKYRLENEKSYRNTKKNYINKNREKIREYRSKYMKKYRLNNKEKIKAHNIANYKIKYIFDNCELCKKRIATEKHHSDYLQPLKVEFLCSSCHHKIHKKKEERKNRKH